jgi:hypothetical protein
MSKAYYVLRSFAHTSTTRARTHRRAAMAWNRGRTDSLPPPRPPPVMGRGGMFGMNGPRDGGGMPPPMPPGMGMGMPGMPGMGPGMGRGMPGMQGMQGGRPGIGMMPSPSPANNPFGMPPGRGGGGGGGGGMMPFGPGGPGGRGDGRGPGGGPPNQGPSMGGPFNPDRGGPSGRGGPPSGLLRSGGPSVPNRSGPLPPPPFPPGGERGGFGGPSPHASGGWQKPSNDQVVFVSLYEVSMP